MPLVSVLAICRQHSKANWQFNSPYLAPPGRRRAQGPPGSAMTVGWSGRVMRETSMVGSCRTSIA